MSRPSQIYTHLLRYDPDKYQYEGPREITQEGIADALGTTRANVAITLSRMGDMVEYKLLKAPGHSRRVKAYFITPYGRRNPSFKVDYHKAINTRGVSAIAITAMATAALFWWLRPQEGEQQ